MGPYYHPDVLLDIGKARVREFHREREAANLVEAARNFQPGRFRIALTKVGSLFKRLAVKVVNRFKSRQNSREKIIVVREQT